MGSGLPNRGTGDLSEALRLDPRKSDQSAILRHDTRARFIIGVGVIAQFVLLVAYIIYKGAYGQTLPDSQLIIGAEIAFVVTVLNYFFGNSSGTVTNSTSNKNDGQSTSPK